MIAFSDPQGEKGPADCMAATIKGHITRFINEGNNVTNAKEMESTILSHGDLPGIRVVMLDSLGEPNFRFYPGGMRVWQAFDIGPSKCISLKGTNGEPYVIFSMQFLAIM